MDNDMLIIKAELEEMPGDARAARIAQWKERREVRRREADVRRAKGDFLACERSEAFVREYDRYIAMAEAVEGIYEK